MKILKFPALLLVAALALTSCKKDNPATGQASDSEEMVEKSTDTAEGDTIVTQTDSITRTNRGDMSIEEQEP